jgi:hypothetical protein
MKILTEAEINELAARCEGQDDLSKSFILYDDSPTLLDTCLDLVEKQRVMREALEAWMTWDYEVQSAKVNGESIYSSDDFRRMRFEATGKGQAALAQLKDGVEA